MSSSIPLIPADHGESGCARCDHAAGVVKPQAQAPSLAERIKPWLPLGAALVLLAVSLALPRGGVLGILAFSTAALSWIIAGRRVLGTALVNLVRGQVFDENFLMSLASLGAFVLGEYHEGAAVMVFYLIGENLQDLAVERSRASIQALLDLRPPTVRVIDEQGIASLQDPEAVEPGAVIQVLPGERVGLDGDLLDPRAVFDTAALTGESLPREALAGDPVLAGFLVQDQGARIKVTRPASQSAAARILDMVQGARAKKARTERFITSFARWYTPAVVGAAVLVALAHVAFLGFTWGDAVHRALVMLVISCPCALVVSVPMAYFGGVGGAARLGILVRGAGVFDTLARLRTVVFDKTGTLSTGAYRTAGFRTAETPEGALLPLEALGRYPALRAVLPRLAPVASGSRHLLSRALSRDLAPWAEPGPVEGAIQEVPGGGLVHQGVDGALLLGNARFLAAQGVAVDASSRGPEEDQGSEVLMAWQGRWLGTFVLEDQPRAEARTAIRDLASLGVEETVILSGDREASVARLAGDMGVDRWRSSCLPQDKLAVVEELLPRGSLAFVGDGINDAPVLARADVGISLGQAGQDAALESADLVIMDDDLGKLPRSIILARKTRRIVVQNITFALAAKLAFLALGAVGLAGMWLAVIADVGVSLVAVANSLRALRAPGAGRA